MLNSPARQWLPAQAEDKDRKILLADRVLGGGGDRQPPLGEGVEPDLGLKVTLIVPGRLLRLECARAVLRVRPRHPQDDLHHNAVEALHRSLRKIIKTRGSFPTDDSALKLLYLAIKNAGLRWRRGIEWTAAMSQFAIQFGERFPGAAR